MELLFQYLLLVFLTLLLTVRVLYGPALRRRLRGRVSRPIPVATLWRDPDRVPPGTS